jgi:hypothetical protein
MDSKTHTRFPFTDMINIHEYFEVEHWAKEFDLRPEELINIIAKAGTSADAVKKYLKN